MPPQNHEKSTEITKYFFELNQLLVKADNIPIYYEIVKITFKYNIMNVQRKSNFIDLGFKTIDYYVDVLLRYFV